MTTGRINQVTVVRPRSPQSQTAQKLPKEPQTISPKARRARVVSTRSSLVKAWFYIAHSVTRCELQSSGASQSCYRSRGCQNNESSPIGSNHIDTQCAAIQILPPTSHTCETHRAVAMTNTRPSELLNPVKEPYSLKYVLRSVSLVIE